MMPLQNQRIRQVPHIVGNWATYVYIQGYGLLMLVPASFFTGVFSVALDLHPTLKPMDSEFVHVSLSKTVYLKVFQIDSFIADLRKELKGREPFRIGFGEVSKYENDEATRAFLAVDISIGSKILAQLVDRVDKVMETHQKDKYYALPKFHCSFGWDFRLPDSLPTKLDQSLFEFGGLLVDQILCRSGDKLFYL